MRMCPGVFFIRVSFSWPLFIWAFWIWEHVLQVQKLLRDDLTIASSLEFPSWPSGTRWFLYSSSWIHPTVSYLLFTYFEAFFPSPAAWRYSASQWFCLRLLTLLQRPSRVFVISPTKLSSCHFCSLTLVFYLLFVPFSSLNILNISSLNPYQRGYVTGCYWLGLRG